MKIITFYFYFISLSRSLFLVIFYCMLILVYIYICIQFILQQHDKRLKIKIQNNLLDRYCASTSTLLPGDLLKKRVKCKHTS